MSLLRKAVDTMDNATQGTIPIHSLINVSSLSGWSPKLHIHGVYMNSPFPKSFSSPGEGHIVVQLQPPSVSALATITFQYPLKLISLPPSANQASVLVFLLTYGGGLVGGDQVRLTIDVQPRARLSIATQGHTKIFKSPSRDVITRQQLHVSVGAGAAACLLPDPVQPFAESVYEQTQIFTLAGDASLCLLDWVSAGRTARGEDWDLWGWSGRNEVWAGGGTENEEGVRKRLLLRDKVILEGDREGTIEEKALRKRMTGLSLFGTLVLKGPLVEDLATFFIEEFAALPRIGAQDFRSRETRDKDSEAVLTPREAWRQERLEQEKEDSLLWSAARVRGCTVVKFGARTVESGRTWIGSMIKEEKSIEQHFGEAAVMCIR
jgi:urease accessory protein